MTEQEAIGEENLRKKAEEPTQISLFEVM